MGYEDPTGTMYLRQRHGANRASSSAGEAGGLGQSALPSLLLIWAQHLGGVGWLVCLFSQGMVVVRFRDSKC